jgi:hypothetical protein
MPAKDQIRGANLIGSRWRQGVAVALDLTPSNGNQRHEQT